jgi:hypothetical protein
MVAAVALAVVALVAAAVVVVVHPQTKYFIEEEKVCDAAGSLGIHPF